MDKTNNQQAGGSKLLRGFVIGSAVGAAAALLMTPKTGKDMRQMIRRKSDDISMAAKDRVVSLTSQAMETAGDVSNKVVSFVGQVKDIASGVGGTINKLASQAKEIGHDHKNEAQQAGVAIADKDKSTAETASQSALIKE